jgi:hypothetical protein
MNGKQDTGNGTRQKQSGTEDPEGAAQATRDNDLTTGHSDPDDGGADNAKGADDKHERHQLVSPFMPLASQM